MKIQQGQLLVVDVVAAVTGPTFSVSWVTRVKGGRLVMGERFLSAGAAGAGNSMSIPLTEGELLEARVSIGGIGSGQGLVWVEATVQSAPYPAGQIVARLLEGWPPINTDLVWTNVGGFVPAAWPRGPTVITPADPAAGAEMSFDLTGWQIRRVISWQSTLVTSAVVANRFAHLNVVYPSGAVLDLFGAGAAVASTTTRYLFGSDVTGITLLAGWSLNQLPVAGSSAGFLITTATLNLQVGDQWTAGNLVVEGGIGSIS